PLADVCNYHPATSYYLRYSTARVSKRLTDGTAACLRARRCTNLASFDLIFSEESECLNPIKRGFLVAAFAKRPSQCPLYCRESIRSTNNSEANNSKANNSKI